MIPYVFLYKNHTNLEVQPVFFPSISTDERYMVHPFARSGWVGEANYMKSRARLKGGEAILFTIPVSWYVSRITDRNDKERFQAAMTILEDYLDSFDGIVITVSHDRYFLDRIVRRIFAFEGNGVISQYEGGYTDYINKKKQQEVAGNAGTLREKNTGKSGSGSGAVQSANIGNAKSTGSIKGNGKQNTGEASNSQKKDDYKHRNKKLKFSYNEQREYETIEDDIANLEEKLERLDKEMNENATNSVKLKELMEAKEETENLLMEKMDRWEYLEDLAKRIGEQ